MLLDPNIAPAEAWNSWSERPAEMVFLPLGVRITPVLYSSKMRQATLICPPEEIRFGRHDLAGEHIAFETFHGGTRLAFAYEKRDPFTFSGGWERVETGEWGLRYWVVLAISAGGREIAFDAASGCALVEVGGRFMALASTEAPVLVTAHDDAEALAADMQANGYFDKSSRGTRGPTLGLRFNLEMMPRQRFAAAVADRSDLAIARARQALEAPPAEGATLQEGRNAGALDAVRDVLGWNTVFDASRRRTYTAASRIWGLGDAVWFNDQCFAALMGSVLDTAFGRANLAVALSNATPQGNMACLVNPRDAWVDRSQAPHGAFTVWTMYLRSRDRALLDAAFAPLARNQLWWRANRDPEGRGLVSCGTSDVGDAMYKGTAFGARNETGMDNSSTHDEAVYDPVTRTLSTFDVGLNSALALDAQMLARMARELGRHDEANRFEALAAETCARIHDELWDAARGLFANRQRDGGFVRSVSPTSFFPLLCGAADADQVVRLLGHLADPDMFATPFGLPNATRNDPAYRDDTYWRGRIWPNVNYLVWQGLRRYGLDAPADTLAEASFALFRGPWSARRLCGENYGAETGEIDDKPGNDPFYTWGAMLPLMAVAQVMDISPWNGWEVSNTGAPVRLGPLASPAGAVTVAVTDGALTLSGPEGALFTTNLTGRLTHIIVERGLLSLTLPARIAAGTWLRLGEGPSARFLIARCGGQEVATRIEQGCRVIDLTGLPPGDRLDCHFEPRT
ncbi:putative isomerase [Angulomicrobium tetraedrale]|uniref:Putative isomerase n=1 Tax=Ancylobacter tetraedralis TaxID=217068 RepID=A0A839Z6H4_9HYPH|nr:trehalase family glycosidase [Ancylobacter tetraedralis]MBB3771289.1 putative isomerase [Ancylobacter tetraedralis]